MNVATLVIGLALLVILVVVGYVIYQMEKQSNYCSQLASKILGLERKFAFGTRLPTEHDYPPPKNYLRDVRDVPESPCIPQITEIDNQDHQEDSQDHQDHQDRVSNVPQMSNHNVPESPISNIPEETEEQTNKRILDEIDQDIENVKYDYDIESALCDLKSN